MGFYQLNRAIGLLILVSLIVPSAADAQNSDTNSGEELWELHQQAEKFAWDYYQHELKKHKGSANSDQIIDAQEILKTKYDEYVNRWHSWDKAKLQNGGAIKHISGLAKEALVCVKKYGNSRLPDVVYSEANPFSHISFKEYRSVIDRMKVLKQKTTGYDQKITCGQLTLNIKFGKSNDGEYGNFRPSKNNPNECTITITPECLKRYHRNGQMLTVVHELGHFIEFALLVDQHNGDIKKAYKEYERRTQELERFKEAKKLGKKYDPSKPTHVPGYHAEEAKVELFSLAAVQNYLGVVCNSLAMGGSFAYAIGQLKLEKDAADELWQQLKKKGGMFPPRLNTGRFAQLHARIKNLLRFNIRNSSDSIKSRNAQFNHSIQTDCVFGGILLGNEARCKSVELLAAGISFRENKPAIEVVCRSQEGTRIFRYTDFDSTDLWAAYHVVNPPQWMQKEYDLDGTEHNLVGSNRFLNHSEFSVHPALANTSLANEAIELDNADLLDGVNELKGHQDQWTALQWFDAPANLEFGNGEIKVVPATGPSNVLIRLRLQSNAPSLPDEIVDASRIHDLVNDAHINAGRKLFKDLADRSHESVYVTRPAYLNATSAEDLELRGRIFKSLNVDQSLLMPILYKKYECLRRIDRFARLLALLRWISDHDFDFPKLPVAVEPQIEFAQTVRRNGKRPSRSMALALAQKKPTNRPILNPDMTRQLKLRISNPKYNPAPIFPQTKTQKITPIDDQTIEVESVFHDYRIYSNAPANSNSALIQQAFGGQLHSHVGPFEERGNELDRILANKDYRLHFSESNKFRKQYLNQIWNSRKPVGSQFLKSTALIDYQSRDVQQFLSANLLGLPEVKPGNQSMLDQWRVALACETVVRDRIYTNFDGYLEKTAKASDVARIREGVCDERAVLLAAMLRAKGIPARVVSGLVYLDNAFNFHAWVEVWINDHWRWLDPSRESGVGATHLVITLNDDHYSKFRSWQSHFLSGMKVEVLDYSYEELKGKKTRMTRLLDRKLPKSVDANKRTKYRVEHLAEKLRKVADQHLGGSDSTLNTYEECLEIAQQLDLLDSETFPILWPNYGMDGLDLLNRAVFLRHVCLVSMVKRIEERHGRAAAKKFASSLLAEDPFSDRIVPANSILEKHNLDD